MPNSRAACRWLIPSTWQARRTRAYRSTTFIPQAFRSPLRRKARQRSNFAPPQLDYPAASVRDFLSAVDTRLCGAKSGVDIADFVETNRGELAEIVNLPDRDIPSHDTFSRLFRLLDPEQMEAALRRFAAAMRQGLGLSAPAGTVAVNGKRLRRGDERGRASMPPLVVGVWDAETRLSI